MIRKKHDIDTKLVSFFVSQDKFDDEINEALLNWFNCLEDKDHANTRKIAILFLKKLSHSVLTEIDYPLKEREELINIFEPLELLLRTALPLKTPDNKPSNVRDHLSHTIRNILFCNFLLKRFSPTNYSSIRKQLIIATIFHDLAYPIEKIKKVAHKLGDATFKNLMNSKGHVEIELNNSDDLLEMLDFFGKTINNLQISIDENIKHNKTEPNIELKDVLDKTIHIYREIISKAIAGQGLFDSSHSISSVILFLKPIVKKWQNVDASDQTNLKLIADICLTMTYHDRGNLIQAINTFDIPLTLRILRIVDELQEWDRESNSYIKDAIIENDPGTVLTLKLIMKNKSENDKCQGALFIPDKINGLIPAVKNGETLKLIIEFPESQSMEKLKKELEKVKEKIRKEQFEISYIIQGNIANYKTATLTFSNNQALINIPE